MVTHNIWPELTDENSYPKSGRATEGNMTRREAEKLHKGDIVVYRARQYSIASVRIRGIAAPLFRLNGLSDDYPNQGSEISWQVLSLPQSEPAKK